MDQALISQLSPPDEHTQIQQPIFHGPDVGGQRGKKQVNTLFTSKLVNTQRST